MELTTLLPLAQYWLTLGYHCWLWRPVFDQWTGRFDRTLKVREETLLNVRPHLIYSVQCDTVNRSFVHFIRAYLLVVYLGWFLSGWIVQLVRLNEHHSSYGFIFLCHCCHKFQISSYCWSVDVVIALWLSVTFVSMNGGALPVLKWWWAAALIHTGWYETVVMQLNTVVFRPCSFLIDIFSLTMFSQALIIQSIARLQ